MAEAETDLFPCNYSPAQPKSSSPTRRPAAGGPIGPRSIDIDILLFGNAMVATAALKIPHRGFAVRRFVLAPVADLAPELRDPVTRRTMRELLPGTAGQGVRRVESRVKWP